MDSDNPAVGWGQSDNYPYQEGSFFGNIFVSPPQALYCNGKDFDIGLVPGRLGVETGAPYTNPYAYGTTYCKDYCSAADAPNSGDGYKSCGGWNHVVTVWRNFDPTVEYKVCNRRSGKCLDVAGGSTANGALVNQYRYKGTSNQMWRITQVASHQYKFINSNSGRALDMKGATTANGTPLNQYDYRARWNQMWSLTPTGDGYYKVSVARDPSQALDVPGSSIDDSVNIQTWNYTGSPNQQWNIIPAN